MTVEPTDQQLADTWAEAVEDARAVYAMKPLDSRYETDLLDAAEAYIASLLARLAAAEKPNVFREQDDYLKLEVERDLAEARLAEAENRAKMWQNTHATELRVSEQARAERDKALARLAAAGLR